MTAITQDPAVAAAVAAAMQEEWLDIPELVEAARQYATVLGCFVGYVSPLRRKVVRYDGSYWWDTFNKHGQLVSHLNNRNEGWESTFIDADVENLKRGRSLHSSMRHTDGSGWTKEFNKQGMMTLLRVYDKCALSWLLAVYKEDGFALDWTADSRGKLRKVIAHSDGYNLTRCVNTGLYYAGCRQDFTLEQALAHWNRADDRAKTFTEALKKEAANPSKWTPGLTPEMLVVGGAYSWFGEGGHPKFYMGKRDGWYEFSRTYRETYASEGRDREKDVEFCVRDLANLKICPNVEAIKQPSCFGS